MKTRKTFYPSFQALESRLTPTLVTPPIPFKPPAPTASFSLAITGVYKDPVRLAEHATFVAEARTTSPGVVFLGDSLTQYWGDADFPTAPGLASWKADFAPLKAANFGVAGDQTQNVLWRIENGELAGKPKVVVLEIGINDLTAGRTPSQVAANIGLVVQAIRTISPSSQVLLLGLLPTALPSINAERVQVNAAIASLGRQPNVTYLDPGAALVGPGGKLAPALAEGEIHLDAAGYAVLAKALVGPVNAALHR